MERRFAADWDVLGQRVLHYQKLVWKVKDCYLLWLNNKTEWNSTCVGWEVAPQAGGSQIHMTHIGPTQVECYDNCFEGWMGL